MPGNPGKGNPGISLILGIISRDNLLKSRLFPGTGPKGPDIKLELDKQMFWMLELC